jgi:hypothetical protein
MSAYGIVIAEPGKMVAKTLAHFDAERVQLLRPVQHYFRHRTFDRQINRHQVFPAESSAPIIAFRDRTPILDAGKGEPAARKSS